jgi:microcystin-dependent protein
MTLYPGALDTSPTVKIDATDSTPTEVTHAAQHDLIATATIAIEAALGTLPYGANYATVKAALADTIYKTPTVDQIITQDVGRDHVILVLKALSNLTTSNLFEGRDSGNAVKAFLDKNFIFSAQGFKINGTLLNSTHLSDAASLAYLNSPAFTGTPTAPTPAASDNSTAIATTAYVQASGIPIGAVIDWPWVATAIPSWALLCYGQAISRAGFPALNTIASASGYPHGNGDGVTTFNLPDYRGRIGVGKDNMGGAAASRITSAIAGFDGTVLGAVGGSQGIVLVTGQLPVHNHTITGSPALTGSPGLSDPGHNHGASGSDSGHIHTGIFVGSGSQFGGTTNLGFGLQSGNVNIGNANISVSVFGNTTGISVNAGSLAVNAGSLSTANTGSATAHPNVQPAIVVNKFIRVQ